jgi:hypothetical protein
MKSSSVLDTILKKSTIEKHNPPILRSKSETNLNKFFKNKEKIKSNLRKLIGVFDSFTNARTTLFFVIIFYFMGKGLNIFVFTILCIYAYLLTFRLIRFWVKNSLMYMLDFVYFGNLALIIFLIFFKDNLNAFLAIFSISTGVIGLTNIAHKNKIELGNSEFLMNTFLDCIPTLATSAIRWKHLIYNLPFDNFISLGYVPFKNDIILWKIILIPFALWLIWALTYLILNGKIFRGFAYSHLFESSIFTFYHSNSFNKVLGDHKKYTIIKYLFLQFVLLLISIPIVINCFYNPYFNLFYLFVMNLILGINTALAKREQLRQMVTKM